MKNWGIHSAWLIGMLLALLIGSLAVQWNGIKDLAGIISFAVGLSSLILAVIAIFQTLSSTGSVEASLSAVREATGSSATASLELAGTANLLQQIAKDAQAASSEALTATARFSTLSSAILESSEAGRTEILELRRELTAKVSSGGAADTTTASTKGFDLVKYSYGGVAALYAAIRSFETGKRFRLTDIFPEDRSITYEGGYLGGLSAVGAIDYDFDQGSFLIKAINIGDIAELKAELADYAFDHESTRVNNRKRIAAVDAYFAESETRADTWPTVKL